MSIRRYSRGDYSSILNIYQSAKLDEFKYEKAIFKLIPLEQDPRRNQLIFESDIYLYESERVLGFGAHLGSDIRALLVHPSARGKGVGDRILKHMLSQISGKASLQVVSSNAPAIALYEKYDFSIAAEFTTSYNDISVMVQKMIRPKS